MKKMRVAFITDQTEIGGGETNLIHVATELSENIEVTIFCPKGKLFDYLSKLPSVHVRRIKIFLKRKWIKFIPIICFNFHLSKRLRNFDIIHSYSLHVLPLVVFFQKKNVWTNHGFWENPVGLRAIVLSTIVNKIICVSQDVYNNAQFDNSKKQLIHLGLPITSDKISNKVYNKSEIRLLCVARFQRIKGQDVFIDALNILSKISNFPKIVIHFVGDVNGTNSDDLKFKREVIEKSRKVDSSKIEIIFNGFKPDVNPFYDQSDLVVIPSRYESFSMVAVESLSKGVPVVAPSVGGLLDIVNSHKIGKLFQASNADSLAENLKSSILNYAEFDRRECIKRANCFSIKKQAEKILVLYQQVIKSNNL